MDIIIKTVNLVHKASNKRAELFSQLIPTYPDYKLSGAKTPTEVDLTADYNIFFGVSSFDGEPQKLIDTVLTLEEETSTYSILDISDETFLEGDLADYYVLTAACASFVTCSSEHIQEAIYEQSGRLAHIVPDVLTPLDVETTEFNENPEVLWYGETRDVLSIRPFITSNVHDIKIATTSHVSHTEDRAKTQLIRNDKTRGSCISDCDVVFLPRTYTPLSEVARLDKVKESTLKGKFVVAPDLSDYDWDSIAFDGTLEKGLEFYTESFDHLSKWIDRKQKILLTNNSEESVSGSLLSALDLTPEDTYQNDLENILNEI